LILKSEDLVRIELAVHIDGYISQKCVTIVIGATSENVCQGSKADAVHAAYYASEAALRLMKVGVKSYEVTDVITKVATEFGCVAMQGFLYLIKGQMSQQILRNVMEGPNKIIQNPTTEQKKQCAEFSFEEGQGKFFYFLF
jgi:methionine aminopeptidase